MATIQRNPTFNAEQAARKMKDAFKGKGCNEQAVIQILTDINNAQRQELKAAYRALYGKELDKDLKSELKGKLETAALALLSPPKEYIISELRGSMKGLGTDEAALADILMPRSNHEIRQMKELYKKMYQRDLEKDVNSETSGQFRETLMNQLKASRDPTEDVGVAIREAEELINSARQKKWDKDHALYRILFQRSYAQLRAIFKLYETATGSDIEDSVKNKTKGDTETGMVSLVRAAKGIRFFYAVALYEAMKGRGTDDNALISVMVSRSEIDLARIAEEYQRLFGTTLAAAVSQETKGDYQTLLLRLLA